jgi:hypothetical protein
MDYGGRDGEEEVLDIIHRGAHDGGADDGGPDDGSQYLNESGEGMELERRDEAQTSTDCDDGSQNVGPLTKSGEVY